jgi:hypothetical protein
MCLIFSAIGKVSVHARRRAGDRPPRPKSAENIKARFFRWNFESAADGSGALAPSEKDRRGIIENRLLKPQHAGPILVV